MFNKAILMGYLAADPIKSYNERNQEVATFNIVTTFRKRVAGVMQSKHVWHEIRAFGRMAENINTNAKHGALVHIDGEIRNDGVKLESGEWINRSYVIATGFNFLPGSLVINKEEE